MTWEFDDVHKLEITENEHDWTVQWFEKVAGKWRKLGPAENWLTLEDIKEQYGIR